MRPSQGRTLGFQQADDGIEVLLLRHGEGDPPGLELFGVLNLVPHRISICSSLYQLRSLRGGLDCQSDCLPAVRA